MTRLPSISTKPEAVSRIFPSSGDAPKKRAYSALLELKLGKNKALARYKAACKYADKDYSPNTRHAPDRVRPAAGSARTRTSGTSEDP